MNDNIGIGRGKESALKRVLRMGALAVGFALAGASFASAGQDRTALLALLHDGRFDAARQALRAGRASGSPDDLFFEAFTTYWRLVFDDDNQELRETLDAELDAVIAAAEKAAADDDTGDARLWGGSSHLLLAELRASQRRPLAAAFEARKAKHLLESAATAGADTSDALFGLGTYNYVADTVPSYVKGLRALLFLPKGNRTLGLDQLNTAASRSRFFALEARTFLITIFSSKHERQYGRAIEERNRLLEAFQGTVAAGYASARLDVSLGRNDAAIETLARVQDRAARLGDVDPVVLRSLELLRARAELASLRPDLAAGTAARALASGSGLGHSIAEDLRDVKDKASREAEGIPWPPPGQSPAAEASAFAASAAAHPERPILALLAGDASLRAGSAQDALGWFERSLASGLPVELQAECRFRQGQAQDLLGRRPEAIALYAGVAATSGFVARDGAFYYQQSPFGRAP